jgi:N-acetylglucosaminyldiphosphoundecaprenol N-acetyl-beta-D-mannosaminyltransferase
MDLDPVTLSQACDRCAAAVRGEGRVVVGVLNVAKLVQVQKDQPLRDAIERCDLVIADGLPLVWAGRMLGQPLPERVAGIDLFLALLRDADHRSWSVFLLGATQAVLDEVLARVAREYPGVRVAGARNGYFRAEEEASIVEDIRSRRPDLLFIGISTPKKEFFLDHGVRPSACRFVMAWVGRSTSSRAM